MKKVVALALVALFGLTGCAPVMLLAVISGGLAAIALPDFEDYRGKAQDASLSASVKQISLAVEMYGVDHDGRYPGTTSWLADLTPAQGRYLPDNQLPKMPWGARRQTNALAVHDLGQQLSLDPKHLTAVGTVLGKGKVSTTGSFDALTYGAVLYEALGKGGYVLYGIGKRGDDAVVGAALASPLDTE